MFELLKFHLRGGDKPLWRTMRQEVEVTNFFLLWGVLLYLRRHPPKHSLHSIVTFFLPHLSR